MSPRSAQQLVEEAAAAAEAGHYSAAAEAFAAALAIDEGDAALHEQHAQCLMELEQYEPAVKAARRATVLQPIWEEAWLTLARSLLNAGQLQGAHQACAKCLELHPGHAEAQEDMATITGLLEQQTRQLVGLPGLVIAADPDGQTGPGCVIWEAGVQLARLFVQLSALQQQQQQQGAGTLQHPAGSPTAASCSCHHHQGQTARVAPTAQSADQLDCVVSVQHLPRLLQGARVLELGAGTGIAGITAAACGAHVTLTDLAEAQALLAANIERNQQRVQNAGGSATAGVLDWGQLAQPGCTAAADVCDREWEWGFGADLVFNAGQVGPVVTAIKRLVELGAGRSRRCFLLSHKQRHEDVDAQLLQALAAAGCSVHRVETGDTSNQHVCMWLIRPLC